MTNKITFSSDLGFLRPKKIDYEQKREYDRKVSTIKGKLGQTALDLKDQGLEYIAGKIRKGDNNNPIVSFKIEDVYDKRNTFETIKEKCYNRLSSRPEITITKTIAQQKPYEQSLNEILQARNFSLQDINIEGNDILLSYALK